jgi:uncharacterized PurR-regulated membrane protein YhhQ (DUF165 family)
MTDAPRDIRRFETAQLVLMFLALVSTFTISQPTLDGFGVGVLVGDVIAISLLIGLTLLVTRGRKNWARWVLLAVYVLGVLMEIWFYRAILASGHPLIDVASVVLRGAALVLPFTPQSTQWLQERRQPA